MPTVPNRAPVPAPELAARVTELADGPRWVIEGNYIDQVSGILWPRADTIVWLDLPLRIVLPRLIRRSLGRIMHRTLLYNGNRETWAALLGRDSVLWWAIRSQRRHVRELPGRLAGLCRTGISVVRLRSPAEISTWLAALDSTAGRPPRPAG